MSQVQQWYPGPEFLPELEQRIRERSPEVVDLAEASVSKLEATLAFTAAEHACLDRGLLAYHLLYVAPVLELAGTSLVPDEEIAELQIVSIFHWRCIDALQDGDRLLVNADRHRQLALECIERFARGAIGAGLEWRGSVGREHWRFFQSVPGRELPADAPGAEIFDAFLNEVLDTDPTWRGSFLFTVPTHIACLGASKLRLYRYLVALLTLDDDLDDVLDDAISGRLTPVVRFLARSGLLRAGRAADLYRHLLILARFLRDRLDHAGGEATAVGARVTATILDIVADEVSRKWAI